MYLFIVIIHIKKSLQTYETLNDPDIKALPLDQRLCRFHDEKINLYKTNITLPYSVSACFSMLRLETEIKYCNCTIHTSPKICVL